MRVEQFILLDEYQQMELIWERGVILAERNANQFRLILYQVDEFYIEETRHLKWNIWYSYRCFTDVEQTQPYLNAIDISQIVS